MNVSVYLPCRAGSERIKNKNTRRFVGKESLLSIKIKTLLKCIGISEICLSTNYDEVIKQSQQIKNPRLKVFKRKNELCLGTTKTEELVEDMQNICSGDIILWTHVTSPFVNQKVYQKIINAYKKLDFNDSLMTVTKHQSFFWRQGKPINYDRTKIKWPNTQTLESLWEVNSGAFVISKKISNLYNDRIGKNPYLFELSRIEAFDIDWVEDFELAKTLWKTYGKI